MYRTRRQSASYAPFISSIGSTPPRRQRTQQPSQAPQEPTPVEIPATLSLRINVRKGQPRTTHRTLKNKSGEQIEPPVIVVSTNSSFNTLRSHVTDKVEEIVLDGKPLAFNNSDLEIFLKHTQRAGHREFCQLTEENARTELSRAWQHFRKTLDKRGNTTEAVVLDIFTYINPVVSNTTLNRGSQASVRQQAESIAQAIRQGSIGQMGRYEMAYSVQTLSRHRNAAQQEGAVPIIPETATRAQRRHIDKMVEEGRVPATPPPDSEDGLITLRITSITFASRDELKRAVGLMPGFRINGLNGNQALPILQRDEPADDPANRSVRSATRALSVESTLLRSPNTSPAPIVHQIYSALQKFLMQV